MISFLLVSNVGAHLSDNDFYHKKAQGWFWYHDPVKKIKKKKIIPPPPPPQSKKEPAKPKGPKPLSAAWMKINLPVYLNKAIDNPTKKNIEAYLYLQKYAMDKATLYSRRVALVTQSNLALGETARSPISTYGSRTGAKIGYKKRTGLLEKIGKKGGLWFFFSSHCPFCKKMAPNIKRFGEIYHVPIVAISVDGKPLDNGYFADDYIKDHGQAASLNIKVTPTTYLYYPGAKKLAPVAFGIISETQLETRVVNAGYTMGLINKKDYNVANAIFRMNPVDTADKLLKSPSLDQQQIYNKLKQIYSAN